MHDDVEVKHFNLIATNASSGDVNYYNSGTANSNCCVSLGSEQSHGPTKDPSGMLEASLGCKCPMEAHLK